MSNEQWINIKDQHPEDGQRVLTWNNKFCEERIQVFNKEYQCWDTEDADDFEFELGTTLHGGQLVIEYWQPLPGKPEQRA